MACSSFGFSTLLVFLFSTGLCFARPSRKLATPNDFIEDVCKLSLNHTLCDQVLRSDPKAPKADFKGLGQISIGISQNYAKTVSNLIVTLSQTTSDPNVIMRYNNCAQRYEDVMDNLIQTRNALNSNDTSTYRLKSAAAGRKVLSCDQVWQGPPLEPTVLKVANQGALELITIVGAVSAYLT